MNFRRIKHMLLRLSPEEKVAGIGAIVVLVSVFLPWFSVQFSSMEKETTVSGFAGDLGIIGVVVFLLTGIATAFLIADHMNLKLPRFGLKKNQIVLGLMGENAFLLLLTMAIYTKRSLEYTNAGMRFGLYAAMIGAVAGTFATFAQTQKHQKKETEAFFSHEEETAEKKAVIEEPEYQEQDYLPKKEEAAIETTEAEQKSFFYEEGPDTVAETEEEIDDTPEEAPVETPQPDDTAEPEGDAVETVLEPSPEEEPVEETSDEEPAEKEEDLPPLSSNMDQGDYLVREAGVKPKKSNIKVDIDSIKPVNKTEEPETQPMSFYDDL